MRPNISVIIPNFNHGRFVAAAIFSVANQLGPTDELIVIDDGSDDDSKIIIAEALQNVPGARLIPLNENRGVISALNRGLAEATRDYICFPAADDLVAPDAFGRALNQLTQHPSAAFCSGIATLIDQYGTHGAVFPTRIILEREGYIDAAKAAYELMVDDSWIVGLVMYRTRLLREAGGFQVELRSFADGFVCRLLAVRHGCCFVPQTLQYWRRADIGFSSGDTLDLTRSDEIGARVERLMSSVYLTDFAPEYAKRWLGRWRFGVRHYAIRHRQAKRWQGLLRFATQQMPMLYKSIVATMAIARLPLALALFAWYRPWDAGAMLRRRLLTFVRKAR